MKTTENSSPDIDIEQFEKNRKRYDASKTTIRYRAWYWLYKQPIRWVLNSVSRLLYKASVATQRLKYKLLIR